MLLSSRPSAVYGRAVKRRLDTCDINRMLWATKFFCSEAKEYRLGREEKINEMGGKEEETNALKLCGKVFHRSSSLRIAPAERGGKLPA